MLAKTHRRFLVESEDLRRKFLLSIGEKRNDRVCANGMTAEMAVIRLHDSWARFCRGLVVISAGTNSRTASGIQLSKVAGARRISDVIPLLISTYPRRQKEPLWFSAVECIDAAKRLNVRNYHNIQGAIGSVMSPADDLRVVRNFFAHRCEATASAIRAKPWYGHHLRFTPQDIPGALVAGGITLFDRWVAQLQLVSEAAVQ